MADDSVHRVDSVQGVVCPITVVAYLYLGLTYGGYPWLIKLMVPRHIPGHENAGGEDPEMGVNGKVGVRRDRQRDSLPVIPHGGALFSRCLLVWIIRESGMVKFAETFSGPVLYGATFFLGLL